MKLLLEIVEGADAGKRASLDRGIEIGRDPGVGLLLADEEVSRRHARVEPDGDGAAIHDLGSTNGSYVNDRPLAGTQRLAPGDRVRVGLTVLELRSEEQVARRPSAVRPAPLIEETEPAFVPAGIAGDEQRPGAGYSAVAHLIDTRVKRRTQVAAFAVLALAGLAVVIFFGAR